MSMALRSLSRSLCLSLFPLVFLTLFSAGEIQIEPAKNRG